MEPVGVDNGACIGSGTTAFTIGARVLVGGVKPGRLRYIGSVHFVPDSSSVWCGIELDEDDGLHDGTVDNIRYFTCRQGHGIMAPRHRVTLNPAAVHQSSRNDIIPVKTGAAESSLSGLTLSPQHYRNITSGIPSPVQLRRKVPDVSFVSNQRAPSPINSLSQSHPAAESCRSFGDFRFRSAGAVTMSSPAKSTNAGIQTIRPLSASMTCEFDSRQQHQQQPYSVSHRSSLTGSRPLSAIIQSTTGTRSSPKRVTFFDEVCLPSTTASRDSQQPAIPEAVLSVDNSRLKTSTEITNRRSRSADSSRNQGQRRSRDDILTSQTRAATIDEWRDSGVKQQQNRRRSAPYVGDSYDEECLIAEIEIRTKSCKSVKAKSFRADAEQMIDDAIADVPTPPETEMQLSNDSIESDYTWTNSIKDSVNRSARSRPKHNREPNSVEKDPEIRDSRSLSDERRRRHSDGTGILTELDITGSHVTSGDGKNTAGLELARTALAQYADLVRAAQECRFGHIIMTPPASRKFLTVSSSWTQPTSANAANKTSVLPTDPRSVSNNCDVGTKPETSSINTSEQRLKDARTSAASIDAAESVWESWSNSSCGGGATEQAASGIEDIEFETFDGEELLLDAAMIDSIDGESDVHSEDSMAMVPHLSDDSADSVELDGAEFTGGVTDSDSRPASMFEDDLLDVTADTQDFVGWQPSKPVAITTVTLDNEGNETTALPSDDNVGWMNDVNDVISQQILHQPWTALDSSDISSAVDPLTGNSDSDAMNERIERPMSLISSSSTDAGCFTYVGSESDMMISSGSAVMSSSVGQFTDEMDESWTTYNNDDVVAVCIGQDDVVSARSVAESNSTCGIVRVSEIDHATAAAAAAVDSNHHSKATDCRNSITAEHVIRSQNAEEHVSGSAIASASDTAIKQHGGLDSQETAAAAAAADVDNDDNNVGHNVGSCDRASEVTMFGEMTASDMTVADGTSKADSRGNANNENVTTEGNDVESTTDYRQFSMSNCQSTNNTAVATDVMTSAIQREGEHGNGTDVKDRITDEKNLQTNTAEKKPMASSFESRACCALAAVDAVDYDCGQNRTSSCSELGQQLDSAAETLHTLSNNPMDSSAAAKATIPSATTEHVQTEDLILPGETIEDDSPAQQTVDRAAVAANDEQLTTSAAPVSTSSTNRRSVTEKQQPDRGNPRSTPAEIETESKSTSSSTNPRARRSKGQDYVASSSTPADRRSQGHGAEPRRSSSVRETSTAKERASLNLPKTRGNGGVENRKAAETVQPENDDGGNQSQSAMMTSSAESAGSGSTSDRRKLSVVERLASGTASSNAKRPDRKSSITTSDTSQTRSSSARKTSTSANAVGVTSADRSKKKAESASSGSSSTAKTSTDSSKSDLPKPEVQPSNETVNFDGDAKEIRNQHATAQVASSLKQSSADSVGNTRTLGTDSEALRDQSSSNDCCVSKSLHDTKLKPTAIVTTDEVINDQAAAETIASVENPNKHNGRDNPSENPDSSNSDLESRSQSAVCENSNEPRYQNLSPSLEGQNSPIVTDNDTPHSLAPKAIENAQSANVNKLKTDSERSPANSDNPAVKTDNDNGSKNPTSSSSKDAVVHENPGKDDRSKKLAVEKPISSRSSGGSREIGSSRINTTRITSSASSVNESSSSKRVATEKYRSSTRNPSKSDPLSSSGPATELKNTDSSKTTSSRNTKVPDKSKPFTATSARQFNDVKANASTTAYSVGSTKASKNPTNSKTITSTDSSENPSNPTGTKTVANLPATRTDRDNAERNSKPSIQATKTTTAKAFDVTDGLTASKEKPKTSGSTGSAVRSTPKQSPAAGAAVAAAGSGRDGDKQQLIDKASTSKQSATRRTVMTSSPQSKASDSSRRASTAAASTNKQASDSNGKRPQTAKATVPLSDQLAEVKALQAQSLQQIDTLTKEKDELLKSIEETREEHRIEIENLKDKHRGEVTDMIQQHRQNLEAQIARVIDQHSHEVNTLKDFNDRQLRELKAEHAAEVTSVNAAHKAEVDKLLAEHQATLDAERASHEAQLQEITDKFEAIKMSLSEKVDQLRLKCDDMSKREQSHAAAGKKHSDRRNQLELEVNSLQVVVEKKNEEIRKLRQNIGDLEIKLEEVPTLKATVSKQHQELENLQAIVSIKNDHERQLAEMHQQLLRRCERESKTVKRLSMNNEELMWRLSRSDIGPIPADDFNEDHEAALQSNASGFDPSPSMSLMSKSCDSSHLTSSSGRGRASSAVTFSARDLKTATKSGSTKSSVESPAGRLRRSGTYDAAEDDTSVAQVSKQPKSGCNKS